PRGNPRQRSPARSPASPRAWPPGRSGDARTPRTRRAGRSRSRSAPAPVRPARARRPRPSSGPRPRRPDGRTTAAGRPGQGAGSARQAGTAATENSLLVARTVRIARHPGAVASYGAPGAGLPSRHDSIRSTTLGCMHDYRERLRVPLAWWLLAVPSVLILGATLYAGLAEPWPVIIMVGLLAGCAAFLIALGLAAIEVRDGAVRAGNASLPLTAVSEVVTLDEKQTARLRGPRADPAAHLYSRPYLKQSVYLAVAPSGPATPYWLIGTRHPAELAAVIERCRVQAGHAPVA